MTETMYLGNRHTLDKVELADVLAEISDNGESAGIVLLWEYVLGVSLEDHAGQVDVMMHRIPVAQWTVICQAIFDTGSAGLTWMNSGPSSFDSEELEQGQCDYVGCVIPTVGAISCMLH